MRREASSVAARSPGPVLVNTPLHLAGFAQRTQEDGRIAAEKGGASPHLATRRDRLLCRSSARASDCADDLAEMFFELCNDQQLMAIVRRPGQSGKTPLSLALDCGNKKAIGIAIEKRCRSELGR
ncbi:unnamed protein product [Trichogramma brassicae]|uniref:Uncharacterized protein n=1 Tax=Trichogramma brassicae TaxID=86971 RepID=A0A6H5HWW9_9HYME|nr:unnamed protein product [Trichogramma brassicae]